MKQTFRDRLQLLMKGERPYTWARKVGIEKGLFQYYWQKGKIPTYENLLKIQNYTGCSLDWLLTGKAVAIDQIENLPMVREENPVYGEMNLRRADSLEKVKKVYASRKDDDIALLEGILEKLIPDGGKKKLVRK
jgi:transcriptional regulator with XRE-family HTH domain